MGFLYFFFFEANERWKQTHVFIVIAINSVITLLILSSMKDLLKRLPFGKILSMLIFDLFVKLSTHRALHFFFCNLYILWAPLNYWRGKIAFFRAWKYKSYSMFLPSKERKERRKEEKRMGKEGRRKGERKRERKKKPPK